MTTIQIYACLSMQELRVPEEIREQSESVIIGGNALRVIRERVS